MIWSLKMGRNNLIFEGKDTSLNEVITRIKFLSWGWFIWREGMRAANSFYFICGRMEQRVFERDVLFMWGQFSVFYALVAIYQRLLVL